MIEIRNPTHQEVSIIVDILMITFSDKFSHIFDNDLEKGRSVIYKFYETITNEELNNYFVAVEDDNVLGAIHLTYHGAKENTSSSSIVYAFQTLGIFRGIRATFALALLDFRDFDKKSCYVDFLGVLPAFQGKGIGTKLLDEADEFARSENFNLLSLSVIGRNTEAIKLYEKLGFRKKRYKSSVLGRLLLGVPDFFYMEKTL